MYANVASLAVSRNIRECVLKSSVAIEFQSVALFLQKVFTEPRAKPINPVSGCEGNQFLNLGIRQFFFGSNPGSIGLPRWLSLEGGCFSDQGTLYLAGKWGYLAGKWGQENLSDCHFPAPIFLPEPITPIYYPLNFERLCIGELRPTSFHALVSAVQHGSKALSGIKPPTGFLNKYFEHRQPRSAAERTKPPNSTRRRPRS